MGRKIDAQEQQRLADKLAKRKQKQGYNQDFFADSLAPVHCACLIHGNGYDWVYVDHLYNMIVRNISRPVVMHVYTEDSRFVPAPYIKHSLIDWGISGPKKSWWYKLQIFNSEHYSGPLLYFDLDTVITGNIDWILKLPLSHFWAVRDFKYLWRPASYGVNSSVMWWDTLKYDYIWKKFHSLNLSAVIKKFHGDQDFISDILTQKDLRFFDVSKIKSWRWQALDGGYNFHKRIHLSPGAGTNINDGTSILIFHGNPKPGSIIDSVIQQHWQ